MYTPRHISYLEQIHVDDWKIKSYTISESDTFHSQQAYQNALTQLPRWLNQMNSFDPSHNSIAFLIVHEGNEGIFVLLNTWVGENMLQTHVYFCDHKSQDVFKKISGDGLFACVWELEIMWHEKQSWTRHYLQKIDTPDFNGYLQDKLQVFI